MIKDMVIATLLLVVVLLGYAVYVFNVWLENAGGIRQHRHMPKVHKEEIKTVRYKSGHQYES